MIPEVCQQCGNIRVQSGKEAPCPFCKADHPLTIAGDDSRHLIFLALIERLKGFLGPDEVYEFEPTRREFETLEHGDQIVDIPVVWRILGKRKEYSTGDLKMWISLRPTAKASREDGQYFVNQLPPHVDPGILFAFPLEQIVNHAFLPIAVEGEVSVLFGGFGNEEQQRQVRDLVPTREVHFWRTSKSAFQVAFRAYFANYHPRGCQGGNYNEECPEIWHRLEGTDCSDVRFCVSCRNRVYLLGEEEDATLHVTSRHCIAKSSDQGITRPRFTFAPGEVVPEGFRDPFDLS